ncbi:MAG TPA: ester cyclase [Chloroflexota bacterium]|nr:ester cyclase [Chloroflexota bacterium]
MNDLDILERNKAIVREYFARLDVRDPRLIDDLFIADCVVHRPELAQPIRGREALRAGFLRNAGVYAEFHSAIEDLIAEADRVVARIMHRVVHRADWDTRIGRVAAAGKSVSWSAIAIFRFEDGRIAEEWVSRDELGMLLQIGPVQPLRSSV